MRRFVLVAITVSCVSVWSGLAGSDSSGRRQPGRTYFDATDSPNRVELVDMPALPKGIRGAFVGSVNGCVIVAGGAESVPVSGNIAGSVFLDTVYVLLPPQKVEIKDERSLFQRIAGWGRSIIGVEKVADKKFRKVYSPWKETNVRLDEPVAFGAAVVNDGALVCIGGCTSNGMTRKVFLVTPDRDGNVTISTNQSVYADLSHGLALHSAQVLDNRIYVIGGVESTEGAGQFNEKMLVLNLPGKIAGSSDILAPLRNMDAKMRRSADKTRFGVWLDEVCADSTGKKVFEKGIFLPMMSVRREEQAYRDALFVFGGRVPGATANVFKVEPSCWKYVPGKSSRSGWIRIGDLPDGLEATCSVPVGPSHLVVLAEKNAKPEKTINGVAMEKGGNSFFLYHTMTDTWLDLKDDPELEIGELFQSEDGFEWVGFVRDSAGKTAPGARNAEFVFKDKGFGMVNSAVVYLYFGLMLYVGYLCSKKERTTEDFFLAGRKIPWWAAGISMWATGVSAISIMAIPAKTYATDWTYIWLGIFPPITLFLGAVLFIPIFRRLPIMSMTEYFEMRFHPSVRAMASFLAILGQSVGRMSVTLLLPSLALSAVTGWDVYFSVIIMGIVATVYTLSGGLSAVVWTDVVQTGVMFLGPIAALLLMVFSLDGGASAFLSKGMEFSKFRFVDLTPDLTVATFWVFVLWALPNVLAVLGQESMQRAWATDGIKAAKKAVYTMALVSIPGTLLFYTIGAGLFAHYAQHPADLKPTMQTDAIFPLYIVQRLPAGVAGLMIASIFAAAMSTLDSAMNSLATIATRDFFRFFKPQADEKARMRFGWWATLVFGVLGAGMALYLATFKSASLWDVFSKIMALIGGGFGCVMVLGLFTKRASTTGVWIGSIVGTVFLVYLEVFTRTSFFIYGTLALCVSCTVGYVASLVFPGGWRNLKGLTVWTTAESVAQDSATDKTSN